MQPAKQQWKPTKLGKVDRTTIQPINNRTTIQILREKISNQAEGSQIWYNLQAKHHASETKPEDIKLNQNMKKSKVKKVDQEIISEKLQDWGQVLLSPRRMSARAGGCFPCFLISRSKGKRRINQINMN